MAGKEKKPKKEKPGLKLDEVRELSRTLVNKPEDFKSNSWDVFKRVLRRVWMSYGGGLYTCGFILFWLYYEITMLIDDIVNFSFEFSGVGDFLLSYFIRFLRESFMNTIRAFAWPVEVIAWNQQWGIILLVVLFAIFPKFIKPRIERLLFGRELTEEEFAD